MRHSAHASALCENESGGVTVLSTFMSLTMCLMLAFVMDTASLYLTRIKLEKASEAAAVGSVLSAPYSGNMIAAATSLAAQNVPSSYATVTKSNDVATGFFDPVTSVFKTGAQPYNAVRVVTSRSTDHSNPVLTFFSRLLGKSSTDVNAISYAVRLGGTCVMVLGTSGTVFSASGNGALKANCPMQVNANASTNGSVSVQVPYACVAGTSSATGWSSPPVQGCNTIADPLRNAVQEPAPSACNYTNATLSGTLSPGLYCFSNKGEIKINGHTTITGSGVTLFFDANSYLTVLGGASLSLTAPTSGPLAGIAIFQTRTPNASANTFTLGGNGTLSVNGLIYLPSSNLNLSGTGSGASNYAQVIVKTMSLSGTPTYTLNSFGSGQITPSVMISHAALVIPK